MYDDQFDWAEFDWRSLERWRSAPGPPDGEDDMSDAQHDGDRSEDGPGSHNSGEEDEVEDDQDGGEEEGDDEDEDNGDASSDGTHDLNEEYFLQFEFDPRPANGDHEPLASLIVRVLRKHAAYKSRLHAKHSDSAGPLQLVSIHIVYPDKNEFQLSNADMKNLKESGIAEDMTFEIAESKLLGPSGCRICVKGYAKRVQRYHGIEDEEPDWYDSVTEEDSDEWGDDDDDGEEDEEWDNGDAE